MAGPVKATPGHVPLSWAGKQAGGAALRPDDSIALLAAAANDL